MRGSTGSVINDRVPLGKVRWLARSKSWDNIVGENNPGSHCSRRSKNGGGRDAIHTELV